jgi:hypothetical protein
MFLLPVSRTRALETVDHGSRHWIEPLEERQFFSAAPAMAGIDLPLKTQSPIFADKIAKNGVTSMLPMSFTSVEVQNGQLVALGKIGNQTFSVPLTLSATQAAAADTLAAAATTPILHLQLGPINLDLLGLKVDTSKICLDINAVSGPGNLLGNLLTSVANLLNSGTPLGSILGNLTGTQLNGLLGGITDLLNGVLGAVLSPANVTGASAAPAAAATPAPVNILHLALGPVDLNLLGLQVGLDNCANGPVTVDITAQPGPGNLLGNLLGNVAHLLDNPSNPNALANLLSRISNLLTGLLG